MNASIEYLGRKGKTWSEFFAGLLLYCLSSPYFFWSVVGNPYGNFFLGVVLAYLFYVNKATFSSKVRWFFISFIAVLVLYWRTSGQNINYFILFSPILIIPFCKDSFANKAYSSFLTIYSFVMSIAIIEYVFAVLGIIPPRSSIAPLNELKGNGYYVFFTMVSQEIPPVRFCGPYDEPGAVGTMCALILAKEDFNFKDKRVIVTFLAGILSISLFFYVAAFVCWVARILRKKKLIVSIMWVSVLLSLALYAVMNVPILTEKIAERLTFDESKGGLAGDNRVDMLIVNDYLSSMEGNAFWFGINDKEHYLDLVEGSSSIFNTIIVNGWLFVICYSLFFIAYFMVHKNRSVPLIVFLFLYIATLYQRPFMFSYFFVFMFTQMARSNSISDNKFLPKKNGLF